MIDWILRTALSKRLLVLGFGFLIFVSGIWAWFSLQKEAYPDVGDTQVTVITEFPGRAAKEVEAQVTIPLERILNGVPKITNRRSKTIFGLSVIYLTFEDGVNDYWARSRVLEKLPEADFPEGVTPRLAPLTGPVGEILRYVVSGTDQYTPMELRTLQDWTIIPKLLQVGGVADVITFGGLVKQYHVVTTPDKLSKYGLSIGEVIDAIEKNNLSTGGNIIRQGGQGFVIRGLGAIQSKEDIEQIVVNSSHGVPVYVKNLGTVEVFPMQPSGILGYSSKPEIDAHHKSVNSAVQGLIAMRRGENVSEVAKNLKAKIEEINNTLPEGVKVNITYDRESLVDYTIRTISWTIFEGISVVVIILVFFIGSLRSALVVATTIPLSLLFAFVMMKITGISVSLLSLGAIDFGIIVDSAVVMVENLLRRYQNATEQERKDGFLSLTFSSSKQVSREIFFSILIIIAAYIPIFTFQRVEGKLFSPMAYTLAFAITGSMILALTLIPVLMSLLYKKLFEQRKHLEWHNPAYEWLERRYVIWVRHWTKNPIRTVMLSIAVVAFVSIGSYLKIGSEFLPQLDEGAVNIRSYFPVGISIQEADKYTPIIREKLISYRPTKLVVTQLGRNEDGTDPYNPNRMEILVVLHDYKLWSHEISKADLLEKMKKDLTASVPGVSFSFSQPILDNVNEAVTGSVADLAIMLDGSDLSEMRKIAKEILQIIKTVPGATEYGIEQEANQAQLVVELNRPEIARFGINVSDVMRMIEAAVGGKPIGSVFEDGKKFDIVVRYKSDYRSSIRAIQNLMVSIPHGPNIPLGQLASVKLKDGPTIIQRQNGKRQISVRVNIKDRDQGSFVKEAQKLVKQKITLPKGYNISWGGQFENLTRSGKRLKMVIPITIIIIFLILYSMYKNVWDVCTAFSAIPFSIAGGLLALAIRGYNMNVSAAVGFISLFGIATMSGILFVSYMITLKSSQKDAPRKSLVKKAAKAQLRPWLTTILPALFGLIPAAFAYGVGSDIQRPLATVIVGGLASGLFLTVTAMPALYLTIDRLRQKFERKKKEEIKIDMPVEVFGEEVPSKNSAKIISILILFCAFTFVFKAPEASAQEAEKKTAIESQENFKKIPDKKPFDQKISLKEAEEILAKKNFDLIAAKLDVDAAAAAAIQAGLWPNPNFLLEQNIYNPNTQKYFDASAKGNTEFEFQQPISMTGRFAKAEKVGKVGEEIAQLLFFDKLRALKLKMRVTFYTIFYLRNTVNFFDENIEALSKTVASTEKLLASKSILESDVLRLKTLLMSLQVDRQNLVNQMREFQSDLRIMLGEDPDSKTQFIPIAEINSLDKSHVDFTVERAFEEARQHRPDLKIAESNVKLEEANLILQKAKAFPDLNVGVRYSRAGSYIRDYYGATVSMDIPIFDRNQGSIKQSETLILRNRKMVNKTEQVLEKEVRLSYLKAKDIDAHYQSVDKSVDDSYKSLAEKMFTAYKKQNIGIIAFSDFLESYRNSVWQINQLKINRLAAFEELNYAVGTELVKF
jgi:cobalt-zinc-cadmium resistance protein CzcA